MGSLYVGIGVAVFVTAAFFYIKALGKRDAELRSLTRSHEVLENAKKIRDRVASMSDDGKRKLLSKLLKR